MIADYRVPPGSEPSREEAGIAADRAPYLRAVWSPGTLERLARSLRSEGPEALLSLTIDELHEAWEAAITELLDPRSPTRQQIDSRLAAGCHLSSPALQAALDAMLAGQVGQPARELIERGRSAPRSGSGERHLAVAVVAGNIPGLAVQAALPALAAGRPLLLKSASNEPFFAAALARLLGERSSALSRALAAATWPGGEPRLEDPLFSLTDTLIAYGRAETLSDLSRRYRGRLVALGPKLSIAVVSGDADTGDAGRALATDVALFEQRGCLSVQTVFTDGDPSPLVRGLAEGLEDLDRRWPMAPMEPGLAAQVQQLRRVAELRRLEHPQPAMSAGTLLIAPEAPGGAHPTLEPLPGGRTVRIQPVERLSDVVATLQPWRGAIQGAALAGERAWRLRKDLARLGVNRLTNPGELQRADALWANGERHLLEVLLD